MLRMNEAKSRSLYQERAAIFLLSASTNCSKNGMKVPLKRTLRPSTAGKRLILRSIYERSLVDVEGKTEKNKILSYKASCVTPSTGEKDYMSRLLTVRGEEGKKALNSTSDYKELQRKVGKEGTGAKSIPALAESLTKSMLTDAESSSRRPCSADFFCKTCGTPFFIVPSRTTKVRLKHLKRSRTRRRRASRLKAAKSRLEKEILQNYRGGGRSFSNKKDVAKSSFSSTIATLADCEIEVSKRHSLSRVTDGTVKNFITYWCTSCGGKSLFKGFEPKQKRDEKATVKNPGVLSVPPRIHKTDSACQRRVVTGTRTKRKSTDMNVDFLALEEGKYGRNEITQISQKHTTYLPLGLGKKKSRPKRQVNKKKSSGLHDFLRSLND